MPTIAKTLKREQFEIEKHLILDRHYSEYSLLQNYHSNGIHKIMKNLILLLLLTNYCSFAQSYDAKDYFEEGLAKSSLKDQSGAIAAYTKAIEIDPDYDNAYFHRALSKYNSKDYSGAIADFTKAIEISPFETAVYYNRRGLTKYKLKDYNGAIIDCTKAIEINPDYGTAYYVRGLPKYKLNDKNGACQDARKALKLGYKNASKLIKKVCN